MIAIAAVVGIAFLAAHAGCFSGLVSGTKNPVQVEQTPVPAAQSPEVTASLPGVAGPGTQETIVLKSIGGQYDPGVINVKKGTKVRIEGDPRTLSGCMAVVNIEGYGISKLILPGDNVIEFTADKTGTFPMYCDMGIGNGKLVVA